MAHKGWIFEDDGSRGSGGDKGKGDGGKDAEDKDDGENEEGTDKYYGSLFSSDLYLISYFEYVIYI